MKDTGDRGNHHRDPVRLLALIMGKREDGGRMQGSEETCRGTVLVQVAAHKAKA